MGRRALDLTGQVFGFWTVVGAVSHQGTKRSWWSARCVCGTEKEIPGSSLVGGKTKSCRPCSYKRAVTHGMSHSPEHDTWLHIKQRCTNPNVSVWKHYGGRGIVVAPEWRDSFESFYRDMGPRPSPRHSIERIDGGGPYGPQNCRWATRSEQMRNTRRSARWTYQGRSLTIAEWSQITGIRQGTLGMRVNNYGWTIDRALTTPVADRHAKASSVAEPVGSFPTTGLSPFSSR